MGLLQSIRIRLSAVWLRQLTRRKPAAALEERIARTVHRSDQSESPQPGRQVRLWFVAEENVSPHRLGTLLFLPQDYGRDDRRWPLLIFLHGAFERGEDFELVKRHGPPRQVETDRTFPFLVLSPQCPPGRWWVEEELQSWLVGLLDHVRSRFAVDEDRVYLTGISMGGFGAWMLAATHPERFAALVPICGGGHPDDADRLRSVPIWAVHGARDWIVPDSYSREMVAAVERAGGDVRLTVLPHAGHECWREIYDDPALYEWLLDHACTARLAGRSRTG